MSTGSPGITADVITELPPLLRTARVTAGSRGQTGKRTNQAAWNRDRATHRTPATGNRHIRPACQCARRPARAPGTCLTTEANTGLVSWPTADSQPAGTSPVARGSLLISTLARREHCLRPLESSRRTASGRRAAEGWLLPPRDCAAVTRRPGRRGRRRQPRHRSDLLASHISALAVQPAPLTEISPASDRSRSDHRLAASLAVRKRRQSHGRSPAVQYVSDLHRLQLNKGLSLLATC